MHKHNVDILITDISMPKMNGVELCRNVRSDFDISHVMIIVISGKNDLELKIASMEHGANAYIEKPLDIEYLRVCTKNLLEQRKLLQKTLCNSISSEKEDNYMLNRYDREFIGKVEKIVMENIPNPQFSVPQLEEKLNMSSATLLRKFKRLLNTTPNSYIKTKRLIMAGQMLTKGETRISEVCFSCGFNSTSYFTKCFHDYYGCSPQTYLHHNTK
jgi:YesN/AraC family two-component response regulator